MLEEAPPFLILYYMRMRFRTRSAVFASLFATLCACGATLVWEDEFDGAQGFPGSSAWTYDVGGGGWGNEELQFYTDRRTALANARVKNGCLTIEARAERYGGNAYTSARLLSASSWTYGRFVIRAKLPSGAGTWPAIWMLPQTDTYGTWPASGEIDIMEHLGSDEGVIHGSLHTAAANHILGNAATTTTMVADAAENFHEYRIDWTERGIWMYVDDSQYFSSENATFGGAANSDKWPFDQPFRILLNLALGGWGGAVDAGALPAAMEVDYVRVYELDRADNGYSRYDGVYDSGWVYDSVLGWSYVSLDPWIWSTNESGWVYAPAPLDESGGWIYVPGGGS